MTVYCICVFVFSALNPLTKTTPPPAERPKKAARVVAEKKSSKPGAKSKFFLTLWPLRLSTIKLSV